MRNNVIYISARPIEESDERAYVRSDGRTVYRQPGWKAIAVVSIVWVGLVALLFMGCEKPAAQPAPAQKQQTATPAPPPIEIVSLICISGRPYCLHDDLKSIHESIQSIHKRAEAITALNAATVNAYEFLSDCKNVDAETWDAMHCDERRAKSIKRINAAQLLAKKAQQ